MKTSTRLEWIFHDKSAVSALASSHAWANTPLGPMDLWPLPWKSALSICLASHFPMCLFLGEELTLVYNDAYLPVMGNKHPTLLGARGQDAWHEIWDTIGPMLAGVVHTGEATWVNDQLLPVNRYGYVEEAYWTYSYSPIKEESGRVTGVFCAVAETTSRYLSARRMLTLQNLSVRTSSLYSTEMVSEVAVNTFAENLHDLPFSLMYLNDQAEDTIRLVRTSGPVPLESVPKYFSVIKTASSTINETRFLQAMRASLSSGSTVSLSPNSETFQLSATATGIAFIPLRSSTTTTTSALPLQSSNNISSLLGVLVVGLNPRRAMDEAYCSFLGMSGATLTSALVTARDHVQAQQRAQALAELDRAKTTFFNNISHEFRTPLTLLIGPLEDLQKTSNQRMIAVESEQLSLAIRNARRLLKLVNTLLDFSRIEAGRVRAHFQRVDLAALTSDLASVFRAACEKAGLRFLVECPEIKGRDVFVDLEMWEKIVLNLIGNAFKFTLRGEVRVSLSAERSAVVLTVHDTGCGIPASDLPRIFQRFFRASKSHGRTHEGTGIGLALVSELVQLHGGRIRVESTDGVGSEFFVTLPYGRAHLPPEQVSDDPMAALGSNRMDWLPAEASGEFGAVVASAATVASTISDSPMQNKSRTTRVLIVDDNADMLGYVARVLSSRYRVVCAPNGAAALEHLRNDRKGADGSDDRDGTDIALVLCDIMMPVMDGFTLLKTIRVDQSLHNIPVILLSARAGQEARAEGISAGADDYLVKPFSATELLVSVEARIQLAQTRLAAIKREKQLHEAQRANEAKDRFLATLSHELRTPLAPALLTLESLLADDRLAFVRGDLELLMRSVSLENEIIGDLLDVTRVRSGKIVLNKGVVDLNSLVQQTALLLQRDITKKKLTFQLQLSASNAIALVDATRIQQILWNLLGNAIKFTPEGGSVLVSSENTLTSSSTSPLIDITVVDSGIGIEVHVLPRIFIAFEQGENVTHRFGGLGLGLTIAHALALLHDGSLMAVSDGKDRGSRFTLRLPLSSSQTALPPVSLVAASLSPLVERSLARKRSAEQASILLVEDNVPTQLVMTRMLSRLGYRVTLASTVAAAKALLASNEGQCFHLLLSDLGLPDGSGIEVLNYARSLDLSLKAIALSGYGTATDITRSLDAGFTEHLTKPINTSLLATALMRVLA